MKGKTYVTLTRNRIVLQAYRTLTHLYFFLG